MPKRNGFSLLIILVLSAIIILTIGGIFLVSRKSEVNLNVNSSATIASNFKRPGGSWNPQSKHPWPMFHGNYNHTGYTSVSGPKKGNLKWKFLVGKVTGRWPNSVAVSENGIIYVAGGDKITALSKDGKEIWSKPYSNSQGPSLGEDGTIYFVSGNSVIAIDSSGKEKWQYETSGNTIFGPTIGPDGTIYQGSWDNYFYAINKNGTLKWKYQTNGAVSYPASINKEGLVILGGGDAHAGPDGNLYVFDVEGRLKWKYDTQMLRVGSPAIGPDGLIYLPASPALLVLDTSGTLQWKKGPNITANQNGNQPEQQGNNQVYGISTLAEALGPPPGQSSKIDVINQQDGDKNDISGITTPGLTPDGLICTNTSQGIIYGIDANKTEVKWSYKTASPQDQDTGLPSFIVIDKDGTCYVGSANSTMYAIDKDGKLKWSYKAEAGITEASPAMGADGTLYFTSQDGYLYAIGD